jgi:transposase-like protein
VCRTFEPRATVLCVARRHQVHANRVFAWRKLFQDRSLSAVSAGEQVVPASAGTRRSQARRATLSIGQCMFLNQTRAYPAGQGLGAVATTRDRLYSAKRLRRYVLLVGVKGWYRLKICVLHVVNQSNQQRPSDIPLLQHGAS